MLEIFYDGMVKILFGQQTVDISMSLAKIINTELLHNSGTWRTS